MTRGDLRECLRREVERWSAKRFDVLVTELQDVVAYSCEEPHSYQVEVQALERVAEYIHVSVAVDDGGWTAFVPVSTSFLVHRDGSVDVPAL